MRLPSRRRFMIRRTCFALALMACWVPAVRAEVKPHPLFGDGMVLQQGVSCPIWGTAGPGEEVTVEIATSRVWEKFGQKADDRGEWRSDLPAKAMNAGGPYTMTIGKTTFKEVYVGEVWIASGQSNMEWSVNASETPAEIKANSKIPKVRLFTVKKTAANAPQKSVPVERNVGKWQECGPDTGGTVSAVAYHFGKELQKALNVPVGIIHTSWGGTAAEEWTGMEVLDAHPEHKGKHPRQAKLYNGMIAPLTPYAIKGAIWYQGESNAGTIARAEAYRELMALLIKNWRDDWKQGDFPFLFVQLAPFMK